MYRPSISAIHGDCAYLISYEYFQSLCRNADLLFVMQAGEPVAGVLIQYDGVDVLMAYAGFKDGDSCHVRNGAASAFYYFAPVWLKEQGFSRVCFGASKAFLHDGVLRTKLLKGAFFGPRKFTPDEQVRIMFGSDSQGLRDFLKANPFLMYTNGNSLTGALFCHESQACDQDWAVRLIEPYRNHKGISRWHVYLMGSNRAAPDACTTRSAGAMVEAIPFNMLLNS